MARRLGFAGTIGPYRSIALGVAEVTVLEMAAAYAALANYGLRVEPTLVARVVDPQGRTLFAHEPAIRRAVDPDLAAQMVHILRQAVDRGTGRRIRALGFGGPAAGKTGTTNDNTDAWFTGFNPDLVASVWVGFDERENHRLVDAGGVQITGGSGATPIWAGFMTAVNAERPRRDFAVPAHLELVAVDPRTGIETALGANAPERRAQRSQRRRQLAPAARTGRNTALDRRTDYLLSRCIGRGRHRKHRQAACVSEEIVDIA